MAQSPLHSALKQKLKTMPRGIYTRTIPVWNKGLKTGPNPLLSEKRKGSIPATKKHIVI